MPDPSAQPGAWRRFAPALGPPVVAGAVLRLWHLGSQVLGGDEPHVLRAALTRPLGEILTTYHAPDSYLPLAALAKLALAAGLPLAEGWLRLPGLAAGLALIVVIPLLARRWLGQRGAVLLAWLLALSPSLVLYSRIVRAYSPLLVLTSVAGLAVVHWLARPGRRWALAYAVPAALAVFTHPVAAPSAAAPLAVAAGRAARRWREEPRLTVEVLQLALLAALAVGLLVGPALPSLRELAATRRQPPLYTLATVQRVAMLEAGTSQPLAALAFWALALLGGWSLWRRHRSLALLSGTVAVAQLAGVVVLSPVGAEQPLLFNRYSLMALPFLLCWVAAGLATLTARLRRGGFVAAGLLAIWTASGPLLEPASFATSFAHHNDFVDFSCSRASAVELPAAYGWLAAQGEPGALLEAPWPTTWRFNRAFYAYQARHGRAVLVGTSEALLADSRLRLARVLPLEPGRLLASPARYLLLHREPLAEERQLEVPACLGARREDQARPGARRLAADAARWAAALHLAWGEPDQCLGSIEIWDLERLRRAGSGAPRERRTEEGT